ncbi:hypothetical protein V8E36_009137 [Tilletia maclaganii]
MAPPQPSRGPLSAISRVSEAIGSVDLNLAPLFGPSDADDGGSFFGYPLDPWPNLGDADGPVTLSSSGSDEVEDYKHVLFVELTALLVRLDFNTRIMEGVRDGLPEFGSFWHVSLFAIVGDDGNEAHVTSCNCATGRVGNVCMHQDVAQTHAKDVLVMKPLSPADAPVAVAFAAPAMHGRSAWYSVVSTRTAEGNALNMGNLDQKRCIVLSADDLEIITASIQNVQGHAQPRPCSHRPIPPPAWCRLPTDAPRAETRLLESLPLCLPLGSNARCHCGKEASAANVIVKRSCRLFHSRGVLKRQIEVQRCTCRKRGECRTVGPDLVELGLFNWNNEIVVTHELLNSYSSQFTSSPTPLSAFCTTVQHAYDEHCSHSTPPPTFLARSTFIKIFFAVMPPNRRNLWWPVGPAICNPNSTLPADQETSELRQQCIGELGSTTIKQSEAMEALKLAFDELLASKSKVEAPVRDWIQSLLALLLDAFAYVALDHSLLEQYEFVLKQVAAEEGIFQLCRPLCSPLLRSLAGTPINAQAARRSASPLSSTRSEGTVQLLVVWYRVIFSVQEHLCLRLQ